MEINSSNLVNNDILNTKKFDNLNVDEIKDEEKLREISNDFESFFINQIMDVSLRSSNIAGEEVGSDIVIKRFVRFETGEGIEKKEEDFAAEVARQMGQ